MSDVSAVPFRRPQFDPIALEERLQGQQNDLLNKIATAVRTCVTECVEEGKNQEFQWWRRNRLNLIVAGGCLGGFLGGMFELIRPRDEDDDEGVGHGRGVRGGGYLGVLVVGGVVTVADEISMRLFEVAPRMPTSWDQGREHREVASRCQVAILVVIRQFLKEIFRENHDLVRGQLWNYGPMEVINLKSGRVDMVWAEHNGAEGKLLLREEGSRFLCRPAAAFRLCQRYAEAIVLGNLASFAKEFFVFEEEKWFVERKGSGAFVEELLADCLSRVGDSASLWQSRLLATERKVAKEKRIGVTTFQWAQAIAAIRQKLKTSGGK
jgi:hypothetical protein